MDEPVNVDLDPEDALRLLLGRKERADEDSGGEDDKDEDDAQSIT
jgi:hypothetical protein